MRCSSIGGGTRGRLLALVLAFASLTLSLTGLVTPAHAAGGDGGAGPGRHSRLTAADDFPRLPPRCYDRLHNPISPCQVTTYPSTRPIVVLWGDSHAWMYLPALRKASRQHHVNLVVMLAGGCPPAIPHARVPGGPYTECESQDVQALDYLRSLVDRGKRFKLVLGAFWSGYREEYRLIQSEANPDRHFSAYAQRLIMLAHYGTPPLFDELGRLAVATDVIGQAGTVPNRAHPCVAGTDPYVCNLPRNRALRKEHANRHWLQRLMQPLVGSPRYIDATSAYCSPTTCFGKVGGIDTFFDNLHLSARLTATMRRFFVPTFDDLF